MHVTKNCRYVWCVMVYWLVLGGLCAAEEGDDLCVEEPEVSACETGAEESIPAQKPVSRAKLEARADSVQVPCCCVALKPQEALSIR